MASIQQLKNGSWKATVYLGKDENGKKIYRYLSAATKKEAAILAAALEADVEKGKVKAAHPTAMTVREAVEKYIADRETRRIKPASPKTTREDILRSKRDMQGIMDLKIGRLTDDLIQAEIDRESARISAKSIRNIWGLVNAAIKAAAPGTTYNVTLPPLERKEITIPNEEQLKEILEKVRGTPMEIPVLLSAVGGFRRGEIAALDLEKDVDYTNNTVRICKDVVIDKHGEWVTKDPKTKSGFRTVPIPAEVIAILQAARDDPGYTMLNANQISDRWDWLTSRMGLPIRFHDLRHYNASLMLMLGVPDKYAMERMGHATTNMLKTTYQHTMDDAKKRVAAQINDYFSESIFSQTESENTMENTEHEKERKTHE